MALDYFALGVIIFVAVTLFYGIIVIHDIPYEIAVKRNHPHQDAIHVSGWVSLFTLHAIWPFLWIWATLYREDRGWGFQAVKDREAALAHELEGLKQSAEQARVESARELGELREKVGGLTARLSALETGAGNTGAGKG